jgi:hypothetical protein
MSRKIEILLTGNSDKAIAAIEDTSAAATEGTDEMTDKYERMGAKVGAIFETIGKKGEELGIAGSSGLSSFGAKLDETEGKTKGFGASMVGLGNKMIMGLAGGAAVVGYEGIKIAMQVSTAQATLQAALKASGHSWDANSAAVAKTEGSMRNLGFTDVDTLGALAQGVIATGSLTKARNSLALATDLSRYKNISLAQSELVIDRALAGNLRGVKQLGINLNVTAGGATALANAHRALALAEVKQRDTLIQDGDLVHKGGKDWLAYQGTLQAVANAHYKLNNVEHSSTIIMSALTSKLKGQGDAFAKTLPGQVDVFKAKLDHLEGDVGTFLIPKLEAVGSAIGKTFDVVVKNPALLGASAALIGLPIIAALGSFANAHIIQPIKNMANFLSGAEKTAPIDANTSAIDRLTEALTANTDTISTDTAATSTDAGVIGAGVGAGGEAAIVGAGVGRGLLRSLGMVGLGSFGAFEASKFLASNPTVQNAHAHVFSALGGSQPTSLSNMPFGAGQAIEAEMAKSSNPAVQAELKAAQAQDKMANAVKAALGGSPKQLDAIRQQSVGIEHAIAKGLEGKSKSPQIVKMLDEAGLGKFVGTSAGIEVSKAIISASKDQTKNWNLPYVIAQGFGKVDSTIGNTLNKHLTGSAKDQQGANKTLVSAGTGLNRAGTGLSAAAQAMQAAAAALESAAARPVHVTVTGGGGHWVSTRNGRVWVAG